MKSKERIEARRMRAAGASVREIAAALGISRSSASHWCADVALTPELAERLRQRNPAVVGHAAGGRGRSARARSVRASAQRAGRIQALGGDVLHRSGCMLYWAEGTKDRNAAILTNTDADMLALFVRFLRECYDVDPGAITLTVNCFLNNGIALDEIEAWWLQRLGLPTTSLRTATVNRPSRVSKGVRPHLPYGTARVAVHSTAIVQSIYGAIQEYAGIERPEWLDCRVGSTAGLLA